MSEEINEALRQVLWSAAKGVAQGLAQKLTDNAVSSVSNHAYPVSP